MARILIQKKGIMIFNNRRNQIFKPKKSNCLLLFFFIVLISCSDKNEKKVTIASVGKINALTFIISDQLWNGEIGDSLRKKFAAPVDGLPQEEPLFTINQYPIKALDVNKTANRNIIIIKNENQKRFDIVQDEFANPQNVIHISGKNTTDIINIIEANADFLIKKIKKTEILETQKIISKNLQNTQKIRRKFKIDLHIPSVYKYVLVKPNFIWLKKEILSGNNSILIYKVPFKTILKDNNLTKNIIKMRDSIGGMYVHSKAKNSKMITEISYFPYFFNDILDKKRAYQTKGTWEIKGDYMSGSFLNYAVLNKKKHEFMVVEGFCYAPSTEKRDLMFELEAIIKSIKFLK